MAEINGSNHQQEITASDSATVIDSPQNSTFITASTNNAPEFPSVIPPRAEDESRTLVLCFDGTGDQFDSDNSNVVEFFSLLKKDDRSKQMVYYQAGIGTYTKPQIATPLGAKLSKSLDEAVAWNLSAHVMDGYEFLMQNYEAGDRICIFGFSRGAYTARGLAGMIHKVGLLPACNHQQVPFAYKMYTRVDEVGWKQSNAFKQAFSVDVPIEFIGVWDTVNSVGLIPRRLPFTTSNTIVRTFRHAVSLDERRAKFKANLWNRPNVKEQKLGVEGQKPERKKPKTARPHPHKQNSLKAMERKYGTEFDLPTDIEEVWFAGCHCDVGGGSVENGTPNTLARIPLRWMIRECFKTGSGIMFHSERLPKLGLDPASLYPTVRKRPPPLPATNSYIQHIPKPVSDQQQLVHYGDVDQLVEVEKTEEEHELLDAMSPIYDQLSLNPVWWILELFPIHQRYQRTDNTWANEYGFNMGNGRFIPKQKRHKIKVHRSVKMRMDAQYPDGTKYAPKASFETALKLGNIEWVD